MPSDLFHEWYARARKTDPLHPNAMTLATVGPDGSPTARMVLMKDFDASGLVFFTNYRSRKGRELAQNPRVALVFWWKNLGRQVRIEGSAVRVSRAEVDAYFASRPRGSRLGAWASNQSATLPSRAELLARYRAVSAKYRGRDVPTPPHWGGYRVTPDRVEFWTDRKNRLHDRIEYRLGRNKRWTARHLCP